MSFQMVQTHSPAFNSTTRSITPTNRSLTPRDTSHAFGSSPACRSVTPTHRTAFGYLSGGNSRPTTPTNSVASKVDQNGYIVSGNNHYFHSAIGETTPRSTNHSPAQAHPTQSYFRRDLASPSHIQSVTPPAKNRYVRDVSVRSASVGGVSYNGHDDNYNHTFTPHLDVTSLKSATHYHELPKSNTQISTVAFNALSHGTPHSITPPPRFKGAHSSMVSNAYVTSKAASPLAGTVPQSRRGSVECEKNSDNGKPTGQDMSGESNYGTSTTDNLVLNHPQQYTQMPANYTGLHHQTYQFNTCHSPSRSVAVQGAYQPQFQTYYTSYPHTFSQYTVPSQQIIATHTFPQRQRTREERRQAFNVHRQKVQQELDSLDDATAPTVNIVVSGTVQLQSNIRSIKGQNNGESGKAKGNSARRSSVNNNSKKNYNKEGLSYDLPPASSLSSLENYLSPKSVKNCLDKADTRYHESSEGDESPEHPKDSNGFCVSSRMRPSGKASKEMHVRRSPSAKGVQFNPSPEISYFDTPEIGDSNCFQELDNDGSSCQYVPLFVHPQHNDNYPMATADGAEYQKGLSNSLKSESSTSEKDIGVPSITKHNSEAGGDDHTSGGERSHAVSSTERNPKHRMDKKYRPTDDSFVKHQGPQDMKCTMSGAYGEPLDVALIPGGITPPPNRYKAKLKSKTTNEQLKPFRLNHFGFNSQDLDVATPEELGRKSPTKKELNKRDSDKKASKKESSKKSTYLEDSLTQEFAFKDPKKCVEKLADKKSGQVLDSCPRKHSVKESSKREGNRLDVDQSSSKSDRLRGDIKETSSRHIECEDFDKDPLLKAHQTNYNRQSSPSVHSTYPPKVSFNVGDKLQTKPSAKTATDASSSHRRAASAKQRRVSLEGEQSQKYNGSRITGSSKIADITLSGQTSIDSSSYKNQYTLSSKRSTSREMAAAHQSKNGAEVLRTPSTGSRKKSSIHSFHYHEGEPHEKKEKTGTKSSDGKKTNSHRGSKRKENSEGGTVVTSFAYTADPEQLALNLAGISTVSDKSLLERRDVASSRHPSNSRCRSAPNTRRGNAPKFSTESGTTGTPSSDAFPNIEHMQIHSGSIKSFPKNENELKHALVTRQNQPLTDFSPPTPTSASINSLTRV